MTHQNSSRSYMRSRYLKDKARGICPNCRSRAPRPGKVACEVCAERNRRINRERRRKMVPHLRVLGICIHCGCRAAMPERVWCGLCSELHTEKTRNLAHRRIAAGMCRTCGKDRDREGTQCESCCAKRRKAA